MKGRAAKLMFIGKNLDKEELEKGLRAASAALAEAADAGVGHLPAHRPYLVFPHIFFVWHAAAASCVLGLISAKHVAG